MPVCVRAIETVVPRTALAQSDVRELYARQPGADRLRRRMLASVFDASGIDTRHTVLDELADPTTGGTVLNAARPTTGGTFVDPATGAFASPATGDRNEVYRREAADLFVGAAEQAVKAVPGLTPGDVTHLITVSCTGFFAPGPDVAIITALGLAPTVARYHLGFMGCYGAFPALRAAYDSCRADPAAVVLIVSVELCTLHLRPATDPDTILAASLFADGGAAAVVTARSDFPGAPALELVDFATTLTPSGDTAMAWTIGNSGFEMVLDSAVPRLIQQHLTDALAPLFVTGDAPGAAVERWAIHPGGRSILDRVQKVLGLTDAQVEPSRSVLRRFGNMSSATILFVLREILHDPAAGGPEQVCAMAFGPGLTVESARLVRQGAALC